jgi:hypothetical protein
MGERVISDPAGYKARQLEKIDGLEYEKAVLDREIANTREQCEAHVKAYESRKADIDRDIGERRNEVAACDEALAKVSCMAGSTVIDYCWLCRGLPSLEERARLKEIGRPLMLSLEPMCPSHRESVERPIAAYEADHPDGVCTDTCGCMSLEQLKTELGL